MSANGAWNISMETPMGTRKASLNLAEEGSVLTGTMSGDAGATPIADGKVDGSKISWKTDITQPMPLTLEFLATVDGDKLSGTVKLGMFGNAPLTGSRV
jgi:hypothetical protein